VQWRVNEDEYIAVLSVVVKCYALPIAQADAELGAALFGSLSPLARHASALAQALRAPSAQVRSCARSSDVDACARVLQRLARVEAAIRAALPANRTYCLAYPVALQKLLEARQNAALRDVLTQCDRAAQQQLPSNSLGADVAIPLGTLLARPFVRLGAQLVLAERWAACVDVGADFGACACHALVCVVSHTCDRDSAR
jgi:hypothetical protein